MIIQLQHPTIDYIEKSGTAVCKGLFDLESNTLYSHYAEQIGDAVIRRGVVYAVYSRSTVPQRAA